MTRAAATDTTCVPLLPPALYLTVVLRFTSAGSRPRNSEQFRMRKFDCTQPSPRRYRHRRRVPAIPGSKPDDRQIALRWRRCQADLHRDPLDHITERLRLTATEERDRALRAVVNSDENGETPSPNAAGVQSTRLG